jgi:hypothetical protein
MRIKTFFISIDLFRQTLAQFFSLAGVFTRQRPFEMHPLHARAKVLLFNSMFAKKF